MRKNLLKRLKLGNKNEKINGKAEVKLLVKDLSKKIFGKKCYENFLINKKFNTEMKFKILINEIASSTELYSSWFLHEEKRIHKVKYTRI